MIQILTQKETINMNVQQMTNKEIFKFQNQLLNWYIANRRIMPWRGNTTPYEVWVSEIMLQQTRVDTVIPYFIRFIERLPKIEDLAMVDDQELLKLWEGLGYYSRVRNMKEAARKVVEEYGGELPTNAKDLQKLKGIGEYTAGAIASISFGERVPAVDGNVLRVMSRLTLNSQDISNTKTKQGITEEVKKILPKEALGDFNQGLIELGALICQSKTQPKCAVCPVNTFCEACIRGLQDQFPKKIKKAKKIQQDKTVLFIQSQDRFAIRKRTRGRLLRGLWEFPNEDGNMNIDEVESMIKDWGLNLLKIEPLKNSKAVFTHINWEMKGYYLLVEEISEEGEFTWATKNEIERDYSVASAFKDYMALLK